MLTIGFPVYNGERHVERALESLLAQTYTNLKIIICDNASTDRTEEVCRRYAKRDTRVTYHRNPLNIGAAANFNRAFELAEAPFFKWAAHDDICRPEYLEACMEVMLTDESVVLCHSEVEIIDDAGKVIRPHDEGLRNTGSQMPAVRFRDLIFDDHWCTDVFGVVRRSVLARTPLIASFVGSDRVLLAELGLYGRYYRVPRILFQNRDHPQRSVHSSNPNSAERAAWFNPSHRVGSPAPVLRRWFEYGRSVNRAPLTFRDRVRCYTELIRWLPAHRWQVKRDLKNWLRHMGGVLKRLVRPRTA